MDLNHLQAITPRPMPSPDRDPQLWKLAQEVEASFLSEMLKTAGVAKTRNTFGGGTGEDQFSTFLVREYASSTVAAGGLGLSESIYQSLVAHKETGK